MIDMLPYIVLFTVAGYLIIEAAEAGRRWWKARSPKRWKLQLTAPDGKPGQAYMLTAKQVKQMIALLRLELEHGDEAH